MSTTTIRLTSDTDSILFSGDDIAGGFIYNNESLDSWFSTPSTRLDPSERSATHGDFDIDQIFTDGARPMLIGQYFGGNAVDADVACAVARDRLTGLFNDGKPVVMTVTDPRMTTTRTCLVTSVSAPWNPWRQFTFAIDLYAADPRRYGQSTTYGPSGLGVASSGLVWPLGTAASGRFFDWGTAGNAGALAVTNDGNTPTFPMIAVGAGGTFTSGFRITEVETGRELTYAAPTTQAGIVMLNNRTRRATVNGNDVTENLSVRKWFSVPARSTRTYQINPLGATTGTPTFSITSASAYL